MLRASLSALQMYVVVIIIIIVVVVVVRIYENKHDDKDLIDGIQLRMFCQNIIIFFQSAVKIR